MYERALDLDQFGSSFNFKLPQGKDTLNTLTGLIASMFMIFMVVFYASMQMHRLNSFGETLVTMSTIDSFFDSSYIVSSEEHGIRFAFALTAYDNNQADYVDESEYGQVSAIYAQWGIDSHDYSDTKIPIRQCKPEELGIVKGEEYKSLFYPDHKNSLRTLEYYHKKFMCTDENIQLRGDYNSDAAKIFKILLEKCD